MEQKLLTQEKEKKNMVPQRYSRHDVLPLKKQRLIKEGEMAIFYFGDKTFKLVKIAKDHFL